MQVAGTPPLEPPPPTSLRLQQWKAGNRGWYCESKPGTLTWNVDFPMASELLSQRPVHMDWVQSRRERPERRAGVGLLLSGVCKLPSSSHLGFSSRIPFCKTNALSHAFRPLGSVTSQATLGTFELNKVSKAQISGKTSRVPSASVGFPQHNASHTITLQGQLLCLPLF